MADYLWHFNIFCLDLSVVSRNVKTPLKSGSIKVLTEGPTLAITQPMRLRTIRNPIITIPLVVMHGKYNKVCP